MGWEHGLDWTASEVAGTFEGDIKSSDSLKCGGFLD